MPIVIYKMNVFLRFPICSCSFKTSYNNNPVKPARWTCPVNISDGLNCPVVFQISTGQLIFKQWKMFDGCTVRFTLPSMIKINLNFICLRNEYTYINTNENELKKYNSKITFERDHHQHKYQQKETFWL